MKKNRRFLIALNHTQGVGPSTALKLLQLWPKLEDMFSLSVGQLEKAGVSKTLASSIAAFNFNKVDADLAWEQSENTNHILTWEDTHYPKLLYQIYDPPIVLYAKGNIGCLNKKSVAVVGSRKPSMSGREMGFTFSYELALHDIVIVSGLALGVDERAHTGCLKAMGKTIAVMGTGINYIYPYRHRDLADEICKNGLLLSEFPRDAKPLACHFPRRNRIISGLSLCTLVVEASLKSGSLITARLALEQNREVLAVPGSLQNPQARGCHQLLQQGAKLVTSTKDILDELPGLNNRMLPGKDKIDNTADDNNFMQYIGYEVTHIDKIVEQSGLGIDEVMCQLAHLELNGLISVEAGGYIRV